jgi:hypothetical protein
METAGSCETLVSIYTVSHLRRPLPSYVYPQQPDILSIPLLEFLMKVDPKVATGQTCIKHLLKHSEPSKRN